MLQGVPKTGPMFQLIPKHGGIFWDTLYIYKLLWHKQTAKHGINYSGTPCSCLTYSVDGLLHILRLFIIDDVLDLWGQPGHLLLVSSSYGHGLGGSSAETLKIGSSTSNTLNSTEYVQPMFNHCTAKRIDLVYIMIPRYQKKTWAQNLLGHFVVIMLPDNLHTFDQ